MEKEDSGRGRSIQRILRRRRSGRFFYNPQEPCHKCGASCWERESHDTWYCFRCGNLGYLCNMAEPEAGSFVQQSDLRKD